MKPLKTLALLLVLAAVFLAAPALAAQSPSLTLSPGSGVPGKTVTVNGSGFGESEGVAVTFDSHLVGKATTNDSGNFSLRFRVPRSLAPGAYPVEAVGEKSRLRARVAFTVKDPSISLSPTSGPPNTLVSVTGTLFTIETVYLYFDSTQVAIATAGDTGFTQAFLVPASATAGAHEVTAIGQSSGLTAQATFTVSPPTAASISLAPTVGPPTTQTTVTGAHFGNNETVDIYFDTTDLVLAATSSSGAFTQNLPVPAAAAPGQHWITALGRSSGLSAQTAFMVRTDWAQFRYGPRHSGDNPFENVLTPGNVSGLGQAWAAATGGAITSSPAVAGGVVYVGSFNSLWEKLYAFNAATGAHLVHFPVTMGSVEVSPSSSPGGGQRHRLRRLA
jgi:hypothetical protein